MFLSDLPYRRSEGSIPNDGRSWTNCTQTRTEADGFAGSAGGSTGTALEHPESHWRIGVGQDKP